MLLWFLAVAFIATGLWTAVIRIQSGRFTTIAAGSVMFCTAIGDYSFTNWTYFTLFKPPTSYTDVEGLTIALQINAALLVYLLAGIDSCAVRLLRSSRLRADPDKKFVVPDPALADKRPHDIAVHIGDDINWPHVEVINRAIEKVRHSPHIDVRLRVTVDTGGGDIAASYAIYNAIYRLSKTHEALIVVSGRCSSGGTIILMSPPPSRRFAIKESRFMIHASRRTKDGKRTTTSRQDDKILMYTYKDQTRLDWPSLFRVMRSGKDYHMNTKKAHRLGFVGAIID